MTKPKTTTTLYKDRNGEFRWKTLAGNNRTVGASTESYKNRMDCIENAKLNGIKRIIDKTVKRKK